jgi:hypothetical protein
LQIRDAFTLIADADVEELLRVAGLDCEFRPAATGVAEGVARYFGNSGCDPGLVLALEPEQFGNAPRSLSYRDNVALALNGQCDDGPTHGVLGLLSQARRGPFSHQNSRIVAAAAEIAVENSRDERRMHRFNKAVAAKVPTGADAV